MNILGGDWQYATSLCLIILLPTYHSIHQWFLSAIIIIIIMVVCLMMVSVSIIFSIVINWNSTVRKICPFFFDMSFYSINLFISIWTHGYFIVALSSSAIIVVQFIAQIVSDLVIKSSSKWVPMSFWNASIIFWALFFCFDTSRCYRVISYIPCPRAGINHFSKESWFLLLENIFKNQDLNARCTHSC